MRLAPGPPQARPSPAPELRPTRACRVVEQGFLCRFGLTPDVTAGPGSNVGVQAEGDKGNLLVWEAQVHT